MRHTIRILRNTVLFAMAVTVTVMLIVQKLTYVPPEIVTNANATVYKTAAAMGSKLSDYEDFQELCTFTKQGTYVIPGLRSTLVGLPEEAIEDKRCIDMVPQGVCATEEYILVSAYCHKKQHNSIIYVIDKENHQYVKSIMLNGKAHVGGIAYDPEFQNIWVCFRSGHISQVGKFTLTALEKYYMSHKEDYLHFSSLYNLEEIAEASFITYHDKKLYIGLFSRGENSGGVVQTYRLNARGELNTEQRGDGEEEPKDDSQKYASPIHIAKIADEVQGITFYKDKVLFAQSYGARRSSHMLICDYVGDDVDYSKEECIDMLMPNMLEQITADGDQLMMIFESCGRPYRFRCTYIIDRVCIMNMDELLELQENKLEKTGEEASAEVIG